MKCLPTKNKKHIWVLTLTTVGYLHASACVVCIERQATTPSCPPHPIFGDIGHSKRQAIRRKMLYFRGFLAVFNALMRLRDQEILF